MTIIIPIERLPALYEGFAKQVPFAASGALNDVAFDARKALQTEILPENLDLNNRFTQNSIRVNRATKSDLVVEVGSTAWYMTRMVSGATTRPRRGYKHEGKSYLVIPVKRTRSGKASRPSITGEPFVIKTKGGKLLLVGRKSKKKLVTLAFLVEEVTHDREVPWEREVEKVVRRQFPKRFAERMEKAIATAR